MSKFKALNLSLECIESLAHFIDRIERRDRKLGDQIRRAGSSIPLNLAEGNRREGKDRYHLWRIAAGSADEVRTALQTARAWRLVNQQTIERPLDLLDQLLAIIWKLTH